MTSTAAAPPEPERQAGSAAPGPAAFLDLARTHHVVPVWREVLADLTTPLAVYERLRRLGGPTFLLESVEQGERWGRHSFLGARPLATLAASAADGVRLEGDLPADVRAAAEAAGDDPLAVLAALVDTLDVAEAPGLPPLFAGFVGYVGWDVLRWIEPTVPAQGTDDLGLDDLRLMLPGLLVAFDHLRQRLLVVRVVLVGEDPAAQHAAARAEIDEVLEALAAPVEAPVLAPPTIERVTDAEANMPPEDFLAAVETAKEHIRAGDAFQVVPSRRLALETDADPLLVYRVLRIGNPSPYMYVFEWPDLQVVGSSPEVLVRCTAGSAQIWPIAGSRPRGATAEEDAALEEDLRADEKERAEHVMLVDLARNDLGRIARIGTVRVEDLMAVHRYSHVMHLVSVVTAELREGVGPVDVIRATFPAGTLAGAPKVRAMQLIDGLEPTRRGPYGGGIGYVDLTGDVDLCIAIRTILFTGGRAYVQAGAGIVADSVPELELEESINKAMGPLAAVRAAERLSRMNG